MLQSLPAPRPDVILALAEVFRDDPRDYKIDLGIGVYRDASGRTPVMRAVKQAEKRLLENQHTKSYVGLAGDAGFVDSMRRLVFADSAAPKRICGIQTPGGSGALRLLSDLARKAAPRTTVWTSTPTWPNHGAVVSEVGLAQKSYRYFDAASRAVDFAGMIDDLEGASAGDIVLLHGCCHNPTGADLKPEEWQTVSELVLRRGLVPFIDLAYLGFGNGLAADAEGLRLMAGRVPEMLVAVSCSKNFGLYRDRVGVAFALSAVDDRANTYGAMTTLARTNWSMPPDHGAAVVRTILEDDGLSADWRGELDAMRQRMNDLRRKLAAALGGRAQSDRFSFLGDHCGMFSLIGASEEQTRKLREDHAIYVIGDGRMNIAGLPEKRLDHIGEAFLAVGL